MSIAFSGMNLHGSSKISFRRHDPSNANCVTLAIEGSEGGEFLFELTLFDLPQSEVEKLYRGFGGPPDYMTSLRMKQMQEQDPEAIL